MKYRKSARTLALVIAGLLACPTVSAQAITFADMNNVPWPGAETSINKAAELGLVVGETINGKSYFKPKDPVSLTQACQLAYKLLTETGKAKADSSVQEKWVTVMNTYKIQSWAHPAVSFCLEEGIVSISDLSGFVSGEVNKSATREQAAEILGRALTVGVPSKTANATSTIFKDNASISSDAIPYVALLNAEKIVNGDDVGKFNPKSTLNRTETAVMVTNLYNVLNSAATVIKPTALGTQSGTVKDMNSLYVNFENSNAYFLFASTGTTVTLNDDSASVAEVVTLFKDGNTIEATLTLDSNNRITKMVATAKNIKGEDKKEKDTEGIITDMTYDDEDDDGKLEINDDSVYYVDDVYEINIEISDEDGDEEEYDWDELLELFEECKDDNKAIEVNLTLYSNGDLKKIVGEITDADDDDKNTDEAEGEVENVTYDEDDEEGEIKVDGETYEAPDTEDVEIEIKDGDGEIDSWEELYDAFKDGKKMEVELVVDDDEVVEITGNVTVTKGYLTGFGDEYLKLEGKKSGNSAKYYFTDYDRSDEDEEEDWEDDAADIEIDGLSNIDTLLDFYETWLDDDDTDLDDDVFDMEIKLDDDGFIVEIEAELD